ncbi:MAG: glycosyltransferase family 2 protein [Acidimicrobiia bacterium]
MSAADAAPGRPVAPLVSVIVPAFNEAEVIEATLAALVEHLRGLEPRYRWEVVVVDDGSTDATAELAAAFAARQPGVRVLRHRVNFRLGQALRYAFGQTTGDYVAVIDCDLSYGPEHITRMLHAAEDTGARIVVASPYMRGGTTTKVPWFRRVLSRGANRLLGAAAGGGLTTVTGMVRVYDGRFLRSLDLRAVDTDINTEIIYKARILHARIVEIPAHLDWSFAGTGGARRPVDGRLSRATGSSLFSSFMFRPFWFFVLPGLVLLAVAAYSFGWVVWHVAQVYDEPSRFGNSGLTGAIQNAYQRAPHTFLVTGITFVLALQLISLGVLAAQAKRYFEELFHLGTSILRRTPAPPAGAGDPLGGVADEVGTEGARDPGGPGIRTEER